MGVGFDGYGKETDAVGAGAHREPLIAIILDGVCGSEPPCPPDALSLPSLGVSSLDLGRLWQRRRPFFLK